MQSEEVRAQAAELSQRAMVRDEAIANWIALALEDDDPDEWVNALVATALDRLNTVPESLAVKKEAKGQLRDMRKAMHFGLAQRRVKRPYFARSKASA